MKWQPIKTAPRDGTKIILAKFGWSSIGPLGIYPPKIDEQEHTLWWLVLGFWSASWENWNDGVEPCGLAGPTHWMPKETLESLPEIGNEQ